MMGAGEWVRMRVGKGAYAGPRRVRMPRPHALPPASCYSNVTPPKPNPSGSVDAPLPAHGRSHLRLRVSGCVRSPPVLRRAAHCPPGATPPTQLHTCPMQPPPRPPRAPTPPPPYRTRPPHRSTPLHSISLFSPPRHTCAAPDRPLPLPHSVHARRGIRCGACARGAQVSTKQVGYRKVQRRSRCTRIRICIRALLSYT